MQRSGDGRISVAVVKFLNSNIRTSSEQELTQFGRHLFTEAYLSGITRTNASQRRVSSRRAITDTAFFVNANFMPPFNTAIYSGILGDYIFFF